MQPGLPAAFVLHAACPLSYLLFNAAYILSLSGKQVLLHLAHAGKRRKQCYCNFLVQGIRAGVDTVDIVMDIITCIFDIHN